MEGLDCRHFCMQGLTEAEACGDNEMQAEFLMQGALLDLQEGRSLEDIKLTLQVCTRVCFRSPLSSLAHG